MIIRFQQRFITFVVFFSLSAGGFAKPAEYFDDQEVDLVDAFEREMRDFSAKRRLGRADEATEHYATATAIVLEVLAQDPNSELRTRFVGAKSRDTFEGHWAEFRAKDHIYKFLRLAEASIPLTQGALQLRSSWRKFRKEKKRIDQTLAAVRQDLVRKLIADQEILIQSGVREMLDKEKDYDPGIIPDDGPDDQRFKEMVETKAQETITAYEDAHSAADCPKTFRDRAYEKAEEQVRKELVAKGQRADRAKQLRTDEAYFNQELNRLVSEESRRVSDQLARVLARSEADGTVESSEDVARGIATDVIMNRRHMDDDSHVPLNRAAPEDLQDLGDWERAWEQTRNNAREQVVRIGGRALVPLDWGGPYGEADSADTRSDLQRQLDQHRDLAKAAVLGGGTWRGYLLGAGLGVLGVFSESAGEMREDNGPVGDAVWVSQVGMAFLPFLEGSRQTSFGFSAVSLVPAVGWFCALLADWGLGLAVEVPPSPFTNIEAGEQMDAESYLAELG